jgi:hypothetical protein
MKMAKHILHIFFFLFIHIEAKAQLIQGKIIDSKKEGLPFAHIRGNKAGEFSISELDGSFKIDVTRSDTLFFSTIGYLDTFIVLKGATTKNYVVTMTAHRYNLPQYLVNAGRKNSPSISKTVSVAKSKRRSNIFFIYGWEITQYIKNSPSLPGKIDEVIFNIAPCKVNTLIRIRVYKNTQNAPGDDLLHESIVIPVKKGADKIAFNLKSKLIAFPLEGCFIGLEWVDPKSKGSDHISKKLGISGYCIEPPCRSFSKIKGGTWFSGQIMDCNFSVDVKVNATFYLPTK